MANATSKKDEELKDEVPDETAADGSDEIADDSSPAIHSLTVVYNGQHTDITARIATPTGYANKRHVLPGHLTAQKLGAAIADAGNW